MVAPANFPRSTGLGRYEEYHPYGSTAWWAGNAEIDVSRKRYRYTGMERDEETGLQCHGVRYYAPWVGRWTSADPIGLGDGGNRFGYCHGGPVGGRDPGGMADGEVSAGETLVAGTLANDLQRWVTLGYAYRGGTPAYLSQERIDAIGYGFRAGEWVRTFQGFAETGRTSIENGQSAGLKPYHTGGVLGAVTPGTTGTTAADFLGTLSADTGGGWTFTGWMRINEVVDYDLPAVDGPGKDWQIDRDVLTAGVRALIPAGQGYSLISDWHSVQLRYSESAGLEVLSGGIPGVRTKFPGQNGATDSSAATVDTISGAFVGLTVGALVGIRGGIRTAFVGTEAAFVLGGGTGYVMGAEATGWGRAEKFKQLHEEDVRLHGVALEALADAPPPGARP